MIVSVQPPQHRPAISSSPISSTVCGAALDRLGDLALGDAVAEAHQGHQLRKVHLTNARLQPSWSNRQAIVMRPSPAGRSTSAAGSTPTAIQSSARTRSASGGTRSLATITPSIMSARTATHGRPAQPHRHDGSPGTAADRAVDPDQPRRAAEPGPDELAAARLAGERPRRSGEVDGGGRVHDTTLTKGCRRIANARLRHRLQRPTRNTVTEAVAMAWRRYSRRR